MALVLGAGVSSPVHDDPIFERLPRSLAEAQELGVEFVELAGFTMNLIAGGKPIPQQVRRLKAVTRGSGLRFTIHGPIAVNFMNAPELTHRHMTVAKAMTEISAELGVERMVIHTGNLPAGDPAQIEAAYARQREALAVLGEFAAEHNVLIVVENVFVGAGGYTALPSKLAQEISAIGHANIRACLDFSHAAINCSARGADFKAEVKALAPLAKHLHVHDSFGDPLQIQTYARAEGVAYGLGDLHLPLGWGSLPWADLMSELTFEEDVIFNLELPANYWFALSESVGAVRTMIADYKAARMRKAA